MPCLCTAIATYCSWLMFKHSWYQAYLYNTYLSMEFSLYSAKRTEPLKEVQRDIPELMMTSDTHWLAHEVCKAVKSRYCAIVTALDNIHARTHEPEALGLSKDLCKQTSIAASSCLTIYFHKRQNSVKPYRQNIWICPSYPVL